MDQLPRAFYARPRRTTCGSAPRCTPSTRTTDAVTVHYRDRGRPLLGDRPTTPSAPCRSRCCATSRSSHAVLAREAEGDPPAQLLRVDQDPVPGPRAASGRRRTASSAARPSPTCPIRRIVLPAAPTPSDQRGASCSPATRGARTPLRWGAMDAETRHRAGPGGRRPDPPVDHAPSSRSAPPTPGTTTPAPGARSPCSTPSSRPELHRRHRRARGPHPLRRRALLAVPRVDSGSARVGHPRRQGGPRSRVTGRAKRYAPASSAA